MHVCFRSPSQDHEHKPLPMRDMSILIVLQKSNTFFHLEINGRRETVSYKIVWSRQSASRHLIWTEYLSYNVFPPTERNAAALDSIQYIYIYIYIYIEQKYDAVKPLAFERSTIHKYSKLLSTKYLIYVKYYIAGENNIYIYTSD